jgi:hypothetical protein
VSDKNVTPSSLGEAIEQALDSVYVPSVEQRRVKAAFLAAITDDPSVDPTEFVTLARAVQVTGQRKLEHWWKQEGFVAWFNNRDEFRQRLEYLNQLALDKAEEILHDDNPKTASARVSLIKTLMEAGGKMAAKQKEVKLLDDVVQRMNRQQLESFLKRAKMLPAEAPAEPVVPEVGDDHD